MALPRVRIYRLRRRPELGEGILRPPLVPWIAEPPHVDEALLHPETREPLLSGEVFDPDYAHYSGRVFDPDYALILERDWRLFHFLSGEEKDVPLVAERAEQDSNGFEILRVRDPDPRYPHEGRLIAQYESALDRASEHVNKLMRLRRRVTSAGGNHPGSPLMINERLNAYETILAAIEMLEGIGDSVLPMEFDERRYAVGNELGEAAARLINQKEAITRLLEKERTALARTAAEIGQSLRRDEGKLLEETDGRPAHRLNDYIRAVECFVKYEHRAELSATKPRYMWPKIYALIQKYNEENERLPSLCGSDGRRAIRRALETERSTGRAEKPANLQK